MRKETFKIGDKVTTDFYPDEKNVIRTIEKIVVDEKSFRSKIGIKITNLDAIDSTWFKKVIIDKKQIDLFGE